MYLSNLKLWNFRKFGSSPQVTDRTNAFPTPNLDLNFTKGLNVLIGENDSGKTAIIDAIKLVLKTHSYEWIQIEKEDFYDGSNMFRIEMYFEDLTDDEAAHFIEWLGWKQEGETVKSYLRLIYQVERNLENDRIFPTDVRAGVDDIGYVLSSEAKEYLKATYLKPLRDARSELVPKKGSRLSQILQTHSLFRDGNNHKLVEILKEFNTQISGYFAGDGDGYHLKVALDNYIQSFDSEDKSSLLAITGTPDLKSILERLALSLNTDLNPGLGTLNRLSMAAELVNLKREEDWHGLRLCLIEEIEAHLHPQAQMRVIKALQQEENKHIQLILTTHSPNLASKLKLEHLIICRGDGVFPMGREYTMLNTENRQDDYIFLEKFIDVTKANLFFAKGVILVEGWAEEILLPSLARYIGCDLTKCGVSVINVGGTAFLRYARIFLRKNIPRMTIPVAVITDIDVHEYEKILNNTDNSDISYTPIDSQILTTRKEEKILELKEQLNIEPIRVFIAPSWTLEYSLWKSSSLSTLFKTTVRQVHPQMSDDNFEKDLAIKLIKSGLNKTDIAYMLATKLDEEKANCGSTIHIDADNAEDTIHYLLKAIKYACGNTDHSR